MPEYTQDELDYDEGHAASCNCLMCDMWRKAKRINRLQAAMYRVTIADGSDPEGAVAALWRAAKEAEWTLQTWGYGCVVCGHIREDGHALDCELDAALSRFRTDGDDSKPTQD